jgi:hypothetical protein
MAFTPDQLGITGQPNTNPSTLSINPSVGATVLTVAILPDGATLRAGGAPTYNGVTMLQAGTTQKAASAPETSCELWYILNFSPDGLSHNISIPNTGLIGLKVCASSFNSTNPAAFDVAGGSNGTSANPSVSVNTATAGELVVAALGDGLLTSPTAQSGTTITDRDNGPWVDSHQYTIAGAAGSVASSWTIASDDWCVCVAAFKEVATALFLNRLMPGYAIKRAANY